MRWSSSRRTRDRYAGVLAASHAARRRRQLDSVTTALPIIFALAIDPSATGTLYAATYPADSFTASSRHQPWRALDPVNTGLPADATKSMLALAIDPASPATVYAALENARLQDTSGGASWSAVSNGLTTLDVISLAVDPCCRTGLAGTDPRRVFTQHQRRRIVGANRTLAL